MKQRPLLGTDLVVPTVILGCAEFGSKVDARLTKTIVDAAIDAGITMFDAADVYGFGRAEEALGLALHGRRADVLVSSKFGLPSYDMGYGDGLGARGGRKYIKHAVKESLRRLRTDWIDLYQIHSPDPSTPVGETLSALSELVQEGLVRFIGHSNFSGWQIADAAHVAASLGSVSFRSTQTRYSLLDREADTEVIPSCQKFGVNTFAYAPLAKGLLAGSVRSIGQVAPNSRLATSIEMVTPERIAQVTALSALADRCGRTMTEMAIAGVTSQPTITAVVVGASSVAQVQELAAAGAIEFTLDELAQIDRICPPRPFTLWAAPRQAQ
jgi:aryl-alcohol dehydrogenase-like predicted oxidoreductase